MQLVFLHSSSELILFAAPGAELTPVCPRAHAAGACTGAPTARRTDTYRVVPPEARWVILGYIHRAVIWALQDPPDWTTYPITFSLLCFQSIFQFQIEFSSAG